MLRGPEWQEPHQLVAAMNWLLKRARRAALKLGFSYRFSANPKALAGEFGINGRLLTAARGIGESAKVLFLHQSYLGATNAADMRRLEKTPHCEQIRITKRRFSYSLHAKAEYPWK